MKKGVVLEVDNHFITLLTPEGEFLKMMINEGRYEIGDEIDFIPNLKKKRRRIPAYFHFSWPKTAIAGAAAILILSSALLPGVFSDKVSAYMTVDLNPSVEVALNKDLKAVEIKGLNKDGKRLIENIPGWKNKDIRYVTGQIIEQSKELGYLKKSKQEILFSTTVVENEKNLHKELKNSIKAVSVKQPIKASSITILEATEKERKNAIKEGMSTGRYVQQQDEARSDAPVKKHKTEPAAPGPMTEEKSLTSAKSAKWQQAIQQQKNKIQEKPGKPVVDKSNEAAAAVKQKTIAKLANNQPKHEATNNKKRQPNRKHTDTKRPEQKKTAKPKPEPSPSQFHKDKQKKAAPPKKHSTNSIKKPVEKIKDKVERKQYEKARIERKKQRIKQERTTGTGKKKLEDSLGKTSNHVPIK
ncbi:anti-sigma factor domain-containing protein [Peribacillus sp. SCS-155]|uniref:anti-sigma factor domain-containing protein n=1 Tax=Peribacillus sedimenti TaxID=3115297 RepID=UPI003905A1C8